MAGKRKQIDWEPIKKEFCAGQLSIKEIGRRHDCSDTAIRKKARQEGWQRNLADKVREKVREKLVRSEVRDQNANEDEIVDEAATRGFQVVISHRKDIRALRELEAKLIDELQNNPTKLYITQYQGGIIEKVVDLTAAEKAQAANNLANVQFKRIHLERRAFNLDDDKTGDDRTIKVIYEDLKAPISGD